MTKQKEKGEQEQSPEKKQNSLMLEHYAQYKYIENDSLPSCISTHTEQNCARQFFYFDFNNVM